MTGGPRAVLLDVDDTLVDTSAAMRTAGAACAGEVWPDADDDALAAFGVHYHADPGGFFHRYTRGELTFDEMRLARLQHSVQAHGPAWGILLTTCSRVRGRTPSGPPSWSSTTSCPSSTGAAPQASSSAR